MRHSTPFWRRERSGKRRGAKGWKRRGKGRRKAAKEKGCGGEDQPPSKNSGYTALHVTVVSALHSECILLLLLIEGYGCS